MINFAEELERQRNMRSAEAGNAQAAPGEYKLCEGIYFTDFKAQNKQKTANSCFEIYNNAMKQAYVPPKEPVLLEADFKEFNRRIIKMIETNEELQGIDDWKSDKDFVEAVEENYTIIDETYKKQLDILKELQTQDHCCDMVKKNPSAEIEKLIEENKKKQAAFIIDYYGLHGKGETSVVDGSKVSATNEESKEISGEPKEIQENNQATDIHEEEEEMLNMDEIMKSKAAKNDEDDHGVYI